ncbi:hypothetical protein GGI24_002474 [Coemansia furcata]|nr:hypothetical protein GGI24_002474 [Coemansia furcata]
MRVPCNITNLVLTYLEERQRLTGIDFSLSEFHKRVYAPLLSVNREWREAVMRRLVRECDFTIDFPITSPVASYPFAVELFTPEVYPMGALVREVTLHLNFEGIANGDVSQILTSPECLVNGFTQATNLNVEIFTSNVIVEEYDIEDVIGYVDDTVSAIKRILPMACNIAVKDNMLHLILGDKLSKASGRLMQKLLNVSTKSAICYTSFIDDTAKYASLTYLTHIEYDVTGNSKKHMRIIHQNAGSLQELCISYNGLAQGPKLIMDSAGTLFTYPRLERLKLTSTSVIGQMSYPVFEEHVPFPSLRNAELMVDYPFGDDTLFRGNSDTLESLCIVTDERLEQILEKYNVFSGEEYKSLKSVTFEINSTTFTRSGAMSSQAHMQILSCLPNVTKFAAKGMSGESRFLTQQPYLNNLQSIRVLDLGRKFLSLSGIITLLQNMTQLSVLRCISSSVTYEVPYAELGDHIGRLHEKLYPLARHLKVLDLLTTGHKYTDNEVDDYVNILACLAVICPSFFPAQMDPAMAGRFNKSLRSLIDDNLFAKHSDSLRRLFIAKR